ncbi:MAG: ABC transporter permease, partial [Fidelibacterota bacterium]
MIPKIAYRHIRTGHRFGFISFTSILSMIGLMLGVASLNVISSFSAGFSNSIRHNLSSLDGHIRITKYQSNVGDDLSDVEIQLIQEKLSSIDEITSVTPYIEKKAIMRLGNQSEGVIVYGIPESALQEIFELDKILIQGDPADFNDGIFIGTELSDNLNVDCDNSLFIFDIERFILEDITNGKKINVKGVFKSGFSEYDKLLVFMPLEKARSFFELGTKATGLQCMLFDADDAKLVDEHIISKLGFSPFVTSTWIERHSTLFNWLSIYDVPIKMVMGFIILIAVFNIAAIL